MEIIFSKLEILWQESPFPSSIILFLLALILLSWTSYVFFKFDYKFSFFGCIISLFVLLFCGWTGNGCNSNLHLKINTFAKTAVVTDNLSNAEYKLNQEDFSGYLKTEYKKTKSGKSKTYHQLFLVLKNSASFLLIESNDLSKIEKTIETLKKEFHLPLYFHTKEIQRVSLTQENFDGRILCDFKFQSIVVEKKEDSCRLSWNLKLAGYIYPILSTLFVAYLIWLDSIFKDRFSKMHIWSFMVISLFVLPLSYLALLKWDSKYILFLEKDKLTARIDSRLFGKREESHIYYTEIKQISSIIETKQESIIITNLELSQINTLEDMFNLAQKSKYLSLAVYGLPVVDKLLLSDLLKKVQSASGDGKFL